MVGSTVPSAFGPLPIHLDDHRSSPAWKLPSLQFDDFDLVIELDHDPNLWLLVHAEIFRRTCAVLGRSFSSDWENLTSSAPEVIEHPRTGERKRVRTRALKLVDHTWLIGGRGVPEVSVQKPKLRLRKSMFNHYGSPQYSLPPLHWLLNRAH